MIDVSDIRRICPNDAGSVRGIPVTRVGLLHFTIEADAAPWGLLTLDKAEEVLTRMGSLHPVVAPPNPPTMTLVAELARALLLGRTLRAPAEEATEPRGSSCTAGPVIDAQGAPAGWACVDFEGEPVAPIEAWEETCEDGWCRPKTQRDPSPFGVALAFLGTVGSTRAEEALPGTVVPWYCQGAVDLARVTSPALAETPVAPVATESQATGEYAPTGQDGAGTAIVEGVAPDAAELPPLLTVKAHRASSLRGSVVHLVFDETVVRGRWVRERGQAVCKPRGLRLGGATDEALNCPTCIEELAKRNIAGG